jgi:hypothetical protein
MQVRDPVKKFFLAKALWLQVRDPVKKFFLAKALWLQVRDPVFCKVIVSKNKETQGTFVFDERNFGI